jgi:hypothetical protein
VPLWSECLVRFRRIDTADSDCSRDAGGFCCSRRARVNCRMRQCWEDIAVDSDVLAACELNKHVGVIELGLVGLNYRCSPEGRHSVVFWQTLHR